MLNNIDFDINEMTLLHAAKFSIRILGIQLEPFKHRYTGWTTNNPEIVVGAGTIGNRMSQNIGHGFKIMGCSVKNIDSIVTQDGQRHEWCSTLIHNNE